VRRHITMVRDVVCWMAAGTALGVLTQPSLLKYYAFAVLLSSILSCLGEMLSRSVVPAVFFFITLEPRVEGYTSL